MSTPHATPAPTPVELSQLEKLKRFWGWSAIISAIAATLPPVFGLLGTVIGMVGAFNELEKTGEADPAALADDISVALLSTMWAMIISFLLFTWSAVSLTLFLVKRSAIRRRASTFSDEAQYTPVD